MPELDAMHKDYSRYRMERAKEDLDAAQLLFDTGNYRIANNRAYYAIFHMLRAVLVFDDFDSSKHSGVIAEFRRKYIKKGIFPVAISKMIGEAFISEMRQIMMICLLPVKKIPKYRLQMPDLSIKCFMNISWKS